MWTLRQVGWWGGWRSKGSGTGLPPRVRPVSVLLLPTHQTVHLRKTGAAENQRGRPVRHAMVPVEWSAPQL